VRRAKAGGAGPTRVRRGGPARTGYQQGHPAADRDAGSLAERQAALVAALVADGTPPAGFDPAMLDAARRAQLRKRAGEAAKMWPLLAASLGPRWQRAFAAHRAGHEPVGALRDGWDMARALRERGELAAGAAAELAERESTLRYDGRSEPRSRARTRARRALAAVIRR
jgi:hypothetical protein